MRRGGGDTATRGGGERAESRRQEAEQGDTERRGNRTRRNGDTAIRGSGQGEGVTRRCGDKVTELEILLKDKYKCQMRNVK